ncbi:MAG: TfoX/Sxy family DNA transformation protein [Candidatus Gracilibacteria bacterium]|nr:TfoX/Sxy family DNA transformation protein [Candidatus Gracilibacteria bacterium]
MSNLTDLPNIGKGIAAKLERIGIPTKEEFLKRDPYQVYEELKLKLDPGLCICALASLVGAKQGIVWHAIMEEVKAEAKKRKI